MSTWIKRVEVPKYAASCYTDIWDGDGWQINYDTIEKKYVLIDVVMPLGVPASGVHGWFDTLKDAQDEATRLGKPDWSEYIEEYSDD